MQILPQFEVFCEGFNRFALNVMNNEMDTSSAETAPFWIYRYAEIRISLNKFRQF